MTTQPIDHGRLEALLAEATPGPWEEVPTDDGWGMPEVCDPDWLVAIHNAAPALIQRSRLLEEAHAWLADAARLGQLCTCWRVEGEVREHEADCKAAALLARLEDTP